MKRSAYQKRRGEGELERRKYIRKENEKKRSAYQKAPAPSTQHPAPSNPAPSTQHHQHWHQHCQSVQKKEYKERNRLTKKERAL